MNEVNTLPALIFDGDCAFCTSSAKKAERWFRLDRVEPWQFADLDALGLSAEQCMASLQWVSRDGRVSSGHLAIAAAMRSRGAIWGVVGRVLCWPVITRLGALVYRWVANNRYRLPGGTAACAVREPTSSQ